MPAGGLFSRRPNYYQLEAAALSGGPKSALAADVAAAHFGRVPGVIAARVFCRGPCSLRTLIKHCEQTMHPAPSARRVQLAVLTLVHHGLLGTGTVEEQTGPLAVRRSDGSAEAAYYGHPDAALCRLCHTQFLNHTQMRFQDEGFHLVQTLLRYGRLSEAQLLELCMTQTPYAHLPLAQQERKREAVAAKLQELVKQYYIELAPMQYSAAPEEAGPSAAAAPAAASMPAALAKKARKRKREAEDADAARAEGGAAAPLLGDASGPAAAAVRVLRVNIVQFLVLMRSAICKQTIERLCGAQAATVCDFLLKHQHRASRTDAAAVPELTHPCIPKLPATSAPLRAGQMLQEAESLLPHLEQAHPRLAGRAVVSRAGGDYAVDQDAVTDALREEILLTELDQRFSPPGQSAPHLARRVMCVLDQKRMLDEGSLSQLVLARDAALRRTLYHMLSAGLVHVREVATTATRDPQKTQYLWSIPPGVARARLTEGMYDRCRKLLAKLTAVRRQSAPELRSEGPKQELHAAQLRLAAAVSTTAEQLFVVDFF
eukprot:TRINITY_DN67610_c0_g1_i1.p1 TRINITY_DN67610_c0_g1~~TRINITY_DN67610_c0_g1_i1.p1  ORF type:complete len:544 (+),score=186.02 TRINITY_DN67610_c0_g1_i1:89-1720(+)